MKPIDYEQALLDPTLVFHEPRDVVRATGLTGEQKREILKRWELDARELQVAEDENMGGGEPNRLIEVEEALRQLEVAPKS
jgi:hypothetical protein